MLPSNADLMRLIICKLFGSNPRQAENLCCRQVKRSGTRAEGTGSRLVLKEISLTHVRVFVRAIGGLTNDMHQNIPFIFSAHVVCAIPSADLDGTCVVPVI